MSLIEKVEKLIEVQHIREEINEFCRNQYKAKVKSQHGLGWNRYDGFSIISKEKIEVKYSYGYADYEYDDSFIINLVEFDRDLKIEEVL